MTNHPPMQPAHNVITKCGGVAEVARITGRNATAVYKWTYPRKRGGTDGIIPTSAMRQLTDAMQRGDVDLKPADFFASDGGPVTTAHTVQEKQSSAIGDGGAV